MPPKKPKRWIPKAGDEIILSDDDESGAQEMRIVGKSQGIIHVVEVVQSLPEVDRPQRPGLMALQEDGGYWWIREPEAVEPWQT